MQEVRQLKILTGFRFFAALHVVCFHNFYMFGNLKEYLPSFFYTFLQTGESAVSFFFILSGFILTHVYKDKLVSNKNKVTYLAARFAKLYPLYILTMLMDAPRVIQLFFDKYNMKEAAIKSGISAAAYTLMLQSWVPRLTPVWNSPAWSLSCEIFFYICFIFTMERIYQSNHKLRNITIFYISPLILFLTLTYTQIINTETLNFKTWWRSFPPIRIFEFFIGIFTKAKTICY